MPPKFGPQVIQDASSVQNFVYICGGLPVEGSGKYTPKSVSVLLLCLLDGFCCFVVVEQTRKSRDSVILSFCFSLFFILFFYFFILLLLLLLCFVLPFSQ